MSTTTTTSAGPDIRQLKDRELPSASFPGDAKSDFRVSIDAKAYDQVHKHAREDTSVEICGVLVGKWGRDEKGPFLAVTASIRGEAATNKFAEVTFTHDTWSKINAQMDKEYASDSIVGWYHTHPDFGIFLSDRDRFIHEHFFNEPGQIALVVDPVRGQEGLFIWSGGKATPISHYWVGGKIRVPEIAADGDADDSPKRRAMKAGSSGAKGGSASGPDQPPPDRGAYLNVVTMVLAGICMLLLGWMLHERLSSGERQKLVEYFLLDRVRLNRDLSAIQQGLQDAVRPLEITLMRNPDVSAKPEVQAALRQAAAGLSSTAMQLSAMNQRYALDPREIGQLAMVLAQKQAEMEAALAPPTTAPGATTAPSPTTAPTTAPAVAAAASQPTTRAAQ